jgi:hypothetical protein
VYVRDDRSLAGTTWHTLVAFGSDIDLMGKGLKLFGYVDLYGSEGTRYEVVYGETQLLLDVGDLAADERGRLFLGIELHASKNAFGNGSGTEVVPQLALQWAF